MTTNSAIIDPTETYRYVLTRVVENPVIGESVRVLPVTFLMLNPSTADHVENDPTIRKCLGFASRWGFSELKVVNLFAYRSTDPRALVTAPDPVGSLNNDYIVETVAHAQWVVCAWGRLPKKLCKREEEVKDLLRRERITARCLGRTKEGFPRHPLYLKYEIEPQLFLEQ